MHRTDFSFELPDSLIAQMPAAERTASRLLVVDNDRLEDRRFPDILELLEANDLLVMNDTRVIPARLYGRKATGGKIEILIERVLDTQHVLAQVRASKAPKPDSRILFEYNLSCRVSERRDDLFVLEFTSPVDQVMQKIGHIPLPPYISRDEDETDIDRYQTVFAEKAGAVAAPTAGLHFDEELLEKVREKGVSTSRITLHVGAGTFQPVRADRLEDHRMHSEIIQVSEDVCAQISKTREQGGRVVALGTTTVRALESASHSGTISPYSGETSIFIYPGYEFQTVDAMITNFHLPESTLLMLVSAFAGRERILAAYHHAVAEQYRFFSYGDAMYINKPDVRP